MTDVLADPSSLTKLGIAGLLALALTTTITAFVREWIVPGGSHLKQMAEKDAQIVKLTMERDKFIALSVDAVAVVRESQQVRGSRFVGRKDAP